MAVRVVPLVVEVLSHETGLWCRRCILPSAVRAYIVMRGGLGMSLLTRDQCLQCGGHDVAVG